jgi:cysteine desulfurase
MPLPSEADLAIVSAHKLGGPVGIGALLVRDYAALEASGGQERGYRRGTENLPGALGFAAALEACSEPYLPAEVIGAVDRLAEQVRGLGGVWLADRLSAPTPYTHALAMPGLSGSAQLMRFDLQGIAVSQGSACSSGSLRASHVLQAMDIEPDLASRTIRVSLGWSTTVADVLGFTDAWVTMAGHAAERAA